MDISERIFSLKVLGVRLKELSGAISDENNLELSRLLVDIRDRNPWFTPTSIQQSLSAWSLALTEEGIERWVGHYPEIHQSLSVKVGVINAGNIPLVGLHDLLSVFITGNTYIGKNATEDPFLLPWIIREWVTLVPGIERCFSFVDKLSGMERVIATGSNNSARYFEYYFGKYPNIIRKNRHAVAIIDGSESIDELVELGRDIFTYYGLGCRNVAKIYVPDKYDFKDFFESIYRFHEVMNHHKYMNNFDYNNSVYLLKQIPFLQNNFLILKEDEAISSPLAVLFFEYYSTENTLIQKLEERQEELQCVAVNDRLKYRLSENVVQIPIVNMGATQFPSLMDYADGVDTVRFLLNR